MPEIQIKVKLTELWTFIVFTKLKHLYWLQKVISHSFADTNMKVS